MKPFKTINLVPIILLMALTSASAHAACTMPGGAPDAGAGDVIFNGAPHNVMQYCDGTDWVAMNGGGGGGMAALTNGQIWIGDAANVATARTMSGDATLSNTGALTIGNNAITTGKIADGTIVGADIANSTITMNKMSAGGTANNTTFLRGDGQWAAPSITESDPKVGAVTNNKWCRGNGSAVICDQDAPTGGGGAGCAGGWAHMEVRPVNGWPFAGCGQTSYLRQCQNGTLVTLASVTGDCGGG